MRDLEESTRSMFMSNPSQPGQTRDHLVCMDTKLCPPHSSARLHECVAADNKADFTSGELRREVDENIPARSITVGHPFVGS